jgi:hypothetical protein
MARTGCWGPSPRERTTARADTLDIAIVVDGHPGGRAQECERRHSTRVAAASLANARTIRVQAT